MAGKERQGRGEERYIMAMKEKQRTEHIQLQGQKGLVQYMKVSPNLLLLHTATLRMLLRKGISFPLGCGWQNF